MNRKYLLASIYWYVNIALFFTFIIISSTDFYITSLAIIFMLYLSIISCCAYIEIILLKNKKSWWNETIYILTMRIPHFIEILFIFFNSKKINSTTKELLRLFSDEELPIFMYFGTFLNFFKSKKFSNKIIELAILDTDIHNGLLKRIGFLNVKFKNHYTYKDGIFYYKMLWKNTTIFLYIIHKDRNRFMSFRLDPNKIIIFPKYKLAIRKYKIDNFYFNGPATPKKFLDHYYGEGWKFAYPNNTNSYGPNIDESEKIIQTNHIKKINLKK